MEDKKVLILKEQIKEKEKEIKNVESLLKKLNEEIDALYDELDNLETLQLFGKIKDKGITVEETLRLLK